MPKYFIQTQVNFWYEGEFANAADAEEFGWNYDNLTYDNVEQITVEELEEDEEDE